MKYLMENVEVMKTNNTVKQSMQVNLFSSKYLHTKTC
jgi:hypothetical protein